MQENNQTDSENKTNDLGHNNQNEAVVSNESIVDRTDVPEVTSSNDVVETSNAVSADDQSVPVETTSVEPSTTVDNNSNTASPFFKRYGLMVGVILLMVVGLLFVLEKDGRVDVGLTSMFQSDKPAAIVNGKSISREDYDSSLNQLLQVAGSQGADTTDPALVEQYKSQAIDTLVNGELLKQAAVAEGVVVTDEEISTRLAQISEGVGGDEALKAKMVEFGITEATLKRDIESEILIQGLFDIKMNVDDMEVTDADIAKLYSDLGGAEAGLPPLEEVREQIVGQIKQNKQQELVSTYIEELRAQASIEILV